MPFRLVCMFGIALWILIVPSFGGSLSVCDQISLNLVQNCGFEAPDLTGWTLVGDNDDGNSRLYRFDTNSGSYDYAMATTPSRASRAFPNSLPTLQSRIQPHVLGDEFRG
jgi:hypothetical protein